MKKFKKYLAKHFYKPPIMVDGIEPMIKIIMYSKIFDSPTLFAVIENEKTIYLSEIRPTAKNLGHGSEMMKMLINYAKENNYQEINGSIYEVDTEHFDRLEHFYTKFNFTITPFEDKEDILIRYKIHLKL